MRVGPPFFCRTRDRHGMHFPTAARNWPVFICESCTVRSVLDRELGSSGDRALLQLERMRIIDLANSWAYKTLSGYSSMINFVRLFEQGHKGLHILPRVHVDRPPNHESIPLAWAEEAYSTRKSPAKGRDTVSFDTTRKILSATRWSHTVTTLITDGKDWVYPEKGDWIRKEQILLADAPMSRLTKGLRGRVGDDSRPSRALTDKQVRAFDSFFDDKFLECTEPSQKRYWAMAGLANQLLWLGWLRARELLDLRWMDIEVTRPADGPTEGLPFGVGCLKLRLAEKTKTSRTKRADVPIAYATTSGHQPGKWYERLLRNRPGGPGTDTDPTWVFRDENGSNWTSAYYRSTFVYPLLSKLKMEGDPLLSSMNNTSGNTIQDHYPSLHMYRRGCKSHVEVLRTGGHQRRKATPLEVYEHGRWRVKRSSESAPVMYREWTLWDRVQISLYCI